MKVLNELTLRNLKMNKKRTAVMIIGIILSTALICGVAGILISFWNSMIDYTKLTTGDYHVTFYDVPRDEIEEIEKNKNVDKTYVAEELGYSYLENGENENKPYLSIVSMSDDYLNKMGITLKDGRLPENSDEIVISEHIKSNGGVDYKIGDEITLDVSDRYSKYNVKLTQREPFEYGGEERLEKKYTKKFKIVGIILRPNYVIEDYSAPGYTVITKMDEITEKANISVLYKNVKDYEKVTEDINEMEKVVIDASSDVDEGQGLNTQVVGEDSTYEQLDKEDIFLFNGLSNTYKSFKYNLRLNTTLLMFEGQNLSDTAGKVMLGIGGIIVGIILVSSVFVIRNGFAISVTERFKTYGMLASVGATKKQLKKTVYFEGLVCGLIAIPLGILSGILAIWILLKVVNYILIDLLNGFVLNYKISILAILVSILISGITIFLSCLSSARKASKIAPMDLIRSSKDIKLKAKKIRCPKIIKKLFKVGGEIAYKNLKRSKKKYRTTVISLVVSIVIFISVFSLIEYGFKISKVYYDEKDFNMTLYSYSNLESEINDVCSFYEGIAKLENIEEYSIRKENYLEIQNQDFYTDFANKIYSEVYGNNEDTEVAKFMPPVHIVAVGEYQYKKFLSKIGKKYEECKDGAILYDTYTYYDEKNDKREVANLYDLKAGDSVEVKVYDNDNAENNKEGKLSIKIVEKTDKLPFSLGDDGNHMGGTLIVSDEYIEKIGYNDYTRMYIYSKNANKLEADIEKYLEDNNLEDNISVYNIEKEVQSINAIVLVISIFLYGFIAVITLIGVTNIFNTITTNMNLRSKEFANLKSIGMTKREFNRMIRLESIFYGSKSLIIGIPIGCVISWFIYKAFENIYVSTFELPYKAIIISIVFVMFVVGIIMKYSLNKINKQNIIETIRNENI